MARPQKQRCICSVPKITGFTPKGSSVSGSVNLTYDEYEVIRLAGSSQADPGGMCGADADLPSHCDPDL